MQGEKLELILKPRNSDEHYKCKMQTRKKLHTLIHEKNRKLHFNYET